MKKFFILLFILFFEGVFAQNTFSKPFVIPELRQWSPSTGELTLSQKTSLVVDKTQEKELRGVAEQFSEDLNTMFALKVKVKVGTPKAGDILFSLGTKAAGSDNPEAYNIEIGKKITITANTPIGALWATRSLLQMAEHSLSLPCGVIGDYPAYDKRGFMLDVARKYFSMEYLHAVVKVMSYYKMNTFQVHLNDNGFKEFAGNDWDKTYSAFRLESETFPGLAASDGHYTKKEFRQFQIDALALGVTIIPEIDAPAHTLSFGKYMPEVASKKYGKDHFDLFNPKTYEFMDRLWAEYLSGDEPVFVNEYVHIGTDEYSNKDTVVVEKFRYFTDHYIKYVESFGKKAALWGALTHANGSTPVKVKDVLMSCWYNGYAEPQDMIKAGYEVLSVPDGYLYIVPAAGYYYDYLNTKYLYESWTPNMIGKEVFEPAHPQIKGGMFAVWNDHCGNGISFQDVHHRLMPAMQTLAVKMWDGANTTMPYNEFETSRQLLSEAPGVNILARPKGGKKGEILNIVKPQQGQENQISDIGYNYRVEFELTALAADKGTVLFESPSSKFYLAEPAEGKVGYSRDGYDYRFNYTVPLNHKVALAIEGTNKETKLFVDGKLLETLAIVPHTISPKMKWVQTLVFPLAKIGDFSGEMENLKVVAM